MTTISFLFLAILYVASLAMLASALREAQLEHRVSAALPNASGGLALQGLIGFVLVNL